MMQGFFTIIGGALLGFIIDIFGRKTPLIIGQFMIAVAIGSVPLFSEVYPWFFFFRVVGVVGGTLSL